MSQASKKPPSLFRLFLRELRHDYFAFAGLVILVTLLPTIFIGAAYIQANHDVMWVTPHVMPVSPADSGTILGLDQFGRNQLHLLFVSARNSLYLTLGVTILSFILGVTIGSIAGFYGGRADNIIMRFIDTWAMLPFLVVVVVLLVTFGRTPLVFITVLTLFTWTGRARLVRAASLQQRQLDYISASKTLGTPNPVIIIREMLPNIVDVIVANFVLTTAANIGIETGITMLGYGLGWDHPSLGTMLQRATNPMFLQHFWWVWAPALILVVVLMLSVNFVGTALQRVTDPRQRHA